MHSTPARIHSIPSALRRVISLALVIVFTIPDVFAKDQMVPNLLLQENADTTEAVSARDQLSYEPMSFLNAPAPTLTSTEKIDAASVLHPLDVNGPLTTLPINGAITFTPGSRPLFPRNNENNASLDQFYNLCDVKFQDNQIYDLTDLQGKCLPENAPRSDFSLTNFSRDLGICKCLKQPESFNGLSGLSSSGTDGLTYRNYLAEHPEINDNTFLQTEMNGNVARLNQMLEAEQNAMLFQASSLPAKDEKTNETLLSLYQRRSNFNVSATVTAAQQKAEQAYNSRSQAQPGAKGMDRIRIGQPNLDLITPPPPKPGSQENYFCMPLRTFMSAKQMPGDDEFFDDIAALPERYNQNDWDYLSLKMRFKEAAGQVSTLAEARRNPEANKLFLRIQFLERNPLYRNLFSAPTFGPSRKKQALYKMIKSAYGTKMSPADRYKVFDRLRYQTGAFFTDEDTVGMVQKGEDKILKALINDVPNRVSQVSAKFDPAGTWTRINFVGNYTGLASTDGRGDVENYERYCPEIEFQSRQNQYMVLEQLEQGFASTYSSDPWSNSEFLELNSHVCSEPRQGPDGTMDWKTYLKNSCQDSTTGRCSPENQQVILAEFLEKYPGGRPERKDLEYLIPFLKGEAQVGNTDRESAQRALAAGSNPNYTRTPEARQNLAQISSDFQREASAPVPGRSFASTQRPAPSTVNAASATTSSTTTAPSSSSSSFAPGQISPQRLDTNFQATSIVPSSPRTESIRSQVKQSDTEVQGIRDQLAGLQSDLAREKSAPVAEQKNDVIQSLTQRLADLERRLADKEKERDDLNRRLLASQEQDRSKASRTIASEDDQEGSRSRFLPDSQSQNSAAPANQQQNTQAQVQASVSPASLGSGGSLGGSALSAPRTTLSDSSRSGGGTTGGELLRAKYNIEPGSDQTSGIVIAQTSSNFNYQQLQADSAPNVITVPLSSAEFQNLPLSEQQQYIAQMDPHKSVFRFAFSDGERFLVRNGSQLQVVPFEATPDRAPASVPERSNRLEDLNNDLRTSR